MWINNERFILAVTIRRKYEDWRWHSWYGCVIWIP